MKRTIIIIGIVCAILILPMVFQPVALQTSAAPIDKTPPPVETLTPQSYLPIVED